MIGPGPAGRAAVARRAAPERDSGRSDSATGNMATSTVTGRVTVTPPVATVAATTARARRRVLACHCGHFSACLARPLGEPRPARGAEEAGPGLAASAGPEPDDPVTARPLHVAAGA